MLGNSMHNKALCSTDPNFYFAVLTHLTALTQHLVVALHLKDAASERCCTVTSVSHL